MGSFGATALIPPLFPTAASRLWVRSGIRPGTSKPATRLPRSVSKRLRSGSAPEGRSGPFILTQTSRLPPEMASFGELAVGIQPARFTIEFICAADRLRSGSSRVAPGDRRLPRIESFGATVELSKSVGGVFARVHALDRENLPPSPAPRFVHNAPRQGAHGSIPVIEGSSSFDSIEKAPLGGLENRWMAIGNQIGCVESAKTPPPRVRSDCGCPRGVL